MAKVVGITGLIGSGKSIVRQALSVLYGMPSFDSDVVAKEVYFFPEVQQEIEAKLSFSPITKEGVLNRKELALALANPQKKQVLEEVNHRAVAQQFDQWKDRQKSEWVGIESAILFTSGFNKLCDFTVAVRADANTRKARVLQRDSHRNERELEHIEALQQKEGEQQKAYANFIIDNRESCSITRAIEALWEQLTVR